MLSVEDEGDIHDLLGFWGWLFSGHHVEEVGGMREVIAGSDEVLALDAVLHVSDDGRDLGEETLGFAEVCFWCVVLAVRIDMCLDGDGGTQDVHRDGVLVVDEVA